MVPGTATAKYADGMDKYFFDGQSQWGNYMTSYYYTPQVSNVSVSGNRATITITPTATEVINGTTYDYPAVEHVITLQKVNRQWLVGSDQFSNQMTQLLGSNPDWKTLIANVPSDVTKSKVTAKTIAPARTNASATVIQPNVYTTILSYNRSAAASYGETYSDNQGPYNGQSGYTNAYNHNFYAYILNGGNDCADFVSQALWYGFGGSNNSTSINNRDIPMLQSSLDLQYPWYGDSQEDGSLMWINAYDLVNDIHDNYNGNYDGVQGYVESATSVLPGDVVLDSSGAGHVQIVTSTGSSPNWGNIAISSHTSNRDNVLISQLYGVPTQPSYIGFTRITQWKMTSNVAPALSAQQTN